MALPDMLNDLAENMVSLHEVNRAEAQQCMIRIQSLAAARVDLHVIIGANIVANYVGDYQKAEPEISWTEVRYRLEQNRNRFGVPLDSVIGEIEAEYEKSLAVLRPIKKQLAFTDALICLASDGLGVSPEPGYIPPAPKEDHHAPSASSQFHGGREGRHRA